MGSSMGSDLTRISSFGRRILVVAAVAVTEAEEETATRGSGRRLRS